MQQYSAVFIYGHKMHIYLLTVLYNLNVSQTPYIHNVNENKVLTGTVRTMTGSVTLIYLIFLFARQQVGAVIKSVLK